MYDIYIYIYIFFSFWLTSLCKTDSRSIHDSTKTQFHSFLWLNSIPLYICTISSLSITTLSPKLYLAEWLSLVLDCWQWFRIIFTTSSVTWKLNLDANQVYIASFLDGQSTSAPLGEESLPRKRGRTTWIGEQLPLMGVRGCISMIQAAKCILGCQPAWRSNLWSTDRTRWGIRSLGYSQEE